jgi:hypothetical protein
MAQKKLKVLLEKNLINNLFIKNHSFLVFKYTPISSLDIKKLLSKKFINTMFILKKFNINSFTFPIGLAYSTFLYNDFSNYFKKNVNVNFYFLIKFKFFICKYQDFISLKFLKPVQILNILYQLLNPILKILFIFKF